LKRHLILFPRYEWVDVVNKVAMNHWCGVACAFVQFITRHNVGVHDPIVINHVQGVNIVCYMCGVVHPNVNGECNVPIVNEMIAQDDL
jgi:hypothetical protein